MNADDDRVIFLSALNHYTFCSRRWALIHLENQFEDNIHTLRGSAEHERVDDARSILDSAEGVRAEYGMPVWSERLGLRGRCDVVEFNAGGTPYPVEFKHGKRKAWLNDDLQLAAQAVCLEDMTGKQVPMGSVFHVQSRRRRVVLVDSLLRTKLDDALADIRRLQKSRKTPAPRYEPRCHECSLMDICQPQAVSSNRLKRELENLFNPAKD